MFKTAGLVPIHIIVTKGTNEPLKQEVKSVILVQQPISGVQIIGEDIIYLSEFR